MKLKEWRDSLEEGKNPCYRCRLKGRDNSGDNFHWYSEDDGGYCQACEYTIPSKEFRKGGELEEKEWSIDIVSKTFTLKDFKGIQKNCSTETNGFRGLTKKTCEFYLVYNEYDTETGEIVRQYYPTTTDYNVTGVKVRTIPKDFYAKGKVGKECELFGQFKFKNSNSKFVIITAGEIDCLSAHQMINTNSKYDPIPVVSPTTGESSAVKQLQNQYEWLNRFEKIVVCYDNDEAGIEATHKIAKALPKGKVYVMNLSLKDTNEYLKANREKEWINCFWKAEKYTPSGVLPSSGVYDLIKDRAVVDKITLPPFLYKMQRMMAGGIPLKSIINLTAGSGVGKTSFVNEFVLHFIFNTPYKVGVCSLESDLAEYGENLLSRYVGRKIALIEDSNEKLAFLNDPEIKEKAMELFIDEESQPRFYINDDRGDFDTLTEKIEQMVIQCGVQIVVIDPASDAIAGFRNEEVELFMQWQKKLTKTYDVTIINIMHSTKSIGGNKSASVGGMPTEENIIGHSSQYKSASANIILVRDKLAEDAIERNTTKAYLPKCRWSGNTGLAGEIYYEPSSHTLYDKDWYIENKTTPKPIKDETPKTKFKSKKEN